MTHKYPSFLAGFQQQHSHAEAQIMYEMLLQHFATLPQPLVPAYLEQIEKDISNNRPIQYIISQVYFSDFELYVAEGVLIPRPETDELVHWVNQEINTMVAAHNVWDIGTGSGCIALGIKNAHSNMEVYASDISDVALQIAQINAAQLQLPIRFFKDDILQIIDRDSLPLMDVIVSNPPYIMPSESATIAAHVKEHEPAAALFVTNEDPLQFYKAIAAVAGVQLKKNGRLYLELHSRHAIATQQYMEAEGWSTLLRKDMQGKERMLRCIKK